MFYSKKLLKVINQIDQVVSIFESRFKYTNFKTDWRILTHVLSNHYSSRVTTTQSLIHYSGLTHATGIRCIKRLIDNKFLYKKKRSKTGKSFSIHPSSNLIKKFHLFLISLENYKTINIDTSDLKNQINSKSNSASSRYVLYPKII